MGKAGRGGPVIAVLGEYDALPALGQEDGVAEDRPVVRGGSGHGCGDNMLGSAALLAAASMKEWLEATGTPRALLRPPGRRVWRLKGYNGDAGAFDGVDLAICWHPAAFTSVFEAGSLACVGASLLSMAGRRTPR